MEITLAPFAPRDIRPLLEWNDGLGPDFLTQWAGFGYSYPLTRGQVTDKLDAQGAAKYLVFALRAEKRTVGTLELNFLNVPAGCATLCRFLIAPEQRLRGLGAKALRAAEAYARERLGLDTLLLKVFEYNRIAVSCYKRAGFDIRRIVTHQNGLPMLEMEKRITHA
ncbi:MAG: GNAT family N-acetyltransferase [Firmicutes bacterium]|nr:GNAT family N-acetyltransferase [Bacillota bacterium]